MADTPLDPQHQPFQLVKGVSEGWNRGWRGIHKDGDPASLAPNELRHALNVRFDEGILRGREGSTLIADLAGAPFYMGNFNMSPRNRLWLAARGCQGVGAGFGTSIFIYDPTVSAQIMTVSVYPSAADSTPHFGSFGTKLFVGYNSILREVPIVDPQINTTPQGLGTSQAYLPLRDFPGYTVVGLLEYPEIGMLFIGLMENATPANGLIVSYNGLSFVTEYTGLRPFAFGRWRNRIVAGQAGQIVWRDATSSTWTAVVSGGFTTYASPNAVAEHRTKTYFAGGAGNLYSYDGTVIATERTIAGVGTLGITGVASHFDGLLYYLWNSGGTNAMKLGKHDSDSSALPFIDTYKDLVGQNANFLNGSGLLSWASALYATRTVTTIIASPIADVLGTWTAIGGNGSGANFPIIAAFPF